MPLKSFSAPSGRMQLPETVFENPPGKTSFFCPARASRTQIYVRDLGQWAGGSEPGPSGYRPEEPGGGTLTTADSSGYFNRGFWDSVEILERAVFVNHLCLIDASNIETLSS